MADDVLGDNLTGTFSSLHIVSAHFDGLGAFTPHSTRVLPEASTRTVGRATATPYASAGHLADAVVRECLYSTLFELLLDRAGIRTWHAPLRHAIGWGMARHALQ